MVFSHISVLTITLSSCRPSGAKTCLQCRACREVVIVGDFPNAFVSWCCRLYSFPFEFSKCVTDVC